MEHNRRGFVLVLSLLTTAVLLALVVSYVSRVITDCRLTSKTYNSTAALNLAEAGVERALWEIINNGMASDGTFSADSFKTSSGDNIGAYYANVDFSDENNAIIISTGSAPNKLSPDSKRTIRVAYVKNNFGRAIGASGTGGILLGKNSIVDSYNSDNGTYAATHTNSDGDISTNGPISIPSNTDVYGDANPGADYPFSSKPAGVSGSWGTRQTPLAYNPIPTETLSAEKALGLAAAGHGVITQSESESYTRTGDNLVVYKTITLTGGSYYFKSITVNNQANIIVSGQSTIYVDGGNVVVNTQGDMNVSGQATFYVDGGNINIDTQGDINTLGVPKNLTIYSTGTNITLITQTDFYGAIYAPNATISLTSKTAGGEIYGAIACKSFISGTNTAVHFDKALLNVSQPFLPSGVTSWQEIQE